MTRSILSKSGLLLCVLLLASCNQAPSAGDAGDASAPASTTSPSAEAQAAAASAAAAGAEVPATDATAAASAPATTAPANDTTVAAPATGLVAGVDYDVIPNGQPYQPINGKIEVVEVFGYVCPACARFEPMFTAWKAKVPADVHVTYVPAPFGAQWTPYARAYYVAEDLGLVDRTHTALFRAIHLEQSLPGEGKKPDEAAVAAFYGKYGADPKSFLADMHSFSTEAKVNRGKQFMIRSGASSTPTIVVDGKYRVIGKTYEDMLRITDGLIRMERAAMERTAR
jgi:thiol:disulfide interchange protein DsbA